MISELGIIILAGGLAPAWVQIRRDCLGVALLS